MCETKSERQKDNISISILTCDLKCESKAVGMTARLRLLYEIDWPSVLEEAAQMKFKCLLV